MRIERRVRRVACASGLVAALLGGLGGRPDLLAQGAPLVLVNADTEVGSVAFRFLSGSTLGEGRLDDATALDRAGFLARVRTVLDPLPGISAPEPEPFSPVALQKDVVRLRRVYERAGFPEAVIDYEVVLDTAENSVDVTFVVDEGRPVTLEAVDVADGSGTPIEEWLPDELLPAWRRFDPLPRSLRGSPYGELAIGELESRATAWLTEHGYPWARVDVAASDTVDSAVTAHLEVERGPRARVDSIRIEGNRRLPRRVLLREVPISRGDWYDSRRVSEGEREVFELEIVRRALAGVASGQPRDSTVTLRLRVDEGLPRMVWGRAGYRSEGGLASEAHWVHRNFLGAARTLTVSGVAETGWLAIEQVPERTYGLSMALRQPYLGHRHVSGSVGPFLSYTEGVRDPTLRYGVDVTTTYRTGLFKAASLQYELSHRKISGAFGLLTMAEVVGRGDLGLSPDFLEAAMRLSGSYGWLDDARVPSSGYLLQPQVEVTLPGSEVDYVRLGLSATGAVPLGGRIALVAQGTAGRLFPFGQSATDDFASIPRAWAGLRDVTFSAGGTSDVRGWGPDLLGPKAPKVTFGPAGDWSAQGYVPVGGLARLTSRLEALLPMPFVPGGHRTFLFFDSGRVWSPGTRYDPPDPELATEGWFHAVGGGLQFNTLFGPIRLGLGYKLNPSILDVVPADRVLDAVLTGTSLSTLPVDEGRRWHIHVSLGMTR